MKMSVEALDFDMNKLSGVWWRGRPLELIIRQPLKKPWDLKKRIGYFEEIELLYNWRLVPLK